jgi:hypothetical protein
VDEQEYNKHGEYYNPNTASERRQDGRLREIIERLRDEDSRQNQRLRELEDSVATMRADIQGLWNSHNRIEVALIGHNGQNGIRGTMMEHYKTSPARLEALEVTISQQTQDFHKVGRQLEHLETTLKTIAKFFGALSGIIGVAGIIVGIIVAF